MTNYSEKFQILSDYHLDVWLTQERLNAINLSISESLELLLASNVLDKILCSWSELEISKDLLPSKNIRAKLETDGFDIGKLQSNPAELSTFRDAIVNAWASYHWQNKLENIYLKKKDLLEKLSFSLINVSSNDLAFEIYYRLQACEESFSDLFDKYDITKEKSLSAGRYKFQPIRTFPAKMHPFIRRLSPGEILKPFMNGKQFSVLIMDDWHPALFDEPTKTLLLYDEFSIWQQELLIRIKSQLFSIN